MFKRFIRKNSMNHTDNTDYSDWMGAVVSILCVVHCAVSPLFFVAKPVFASMMVSPHGHPHGLWASLDYIFLVLSLMAVWYSSEHTTHATLRWVLWASWVVFAIGLFFEPLEFPFGPWLMYAGSISLVIAHLQNYRHCQHCKIEVSN